MINTREFDGVKLDVLINSYEGMDITDAANLGLVVELAKDLAIEEYWLNKAYGDAQRKYNSYHVLRRTKFSKEVKRMISEGSKVTQAKEEALLVVQETYNSEYDWKTMAERLKALKDGLKNIQQRLNQDIARLRRILANQQELENYSH